MQTLEDEERSPLFKEARPRPKKKIINEGRAMGQGVLSDGEHDVRLWPLNMAERLRRAELWYLGLLPFSIIRNGLRALIIPREDSPDVQRSWRSQGGIPY
jgi:hypothetical protein